MADGPSEESMAKVERAFEEAPALQGVSLMEPGSDDPIVRMDIAEFREKGYLQEVNRLFLHPLGMALEVMIMPDGTEHLGGVWDYRDDPEGMAYGDEIDLRPHAATVHAEWRAREEERVARLGWMIQPPEPEHVHEWENRGDDHG